MCADDERKFIVEFIEVYRTLPSLWNVETKEYHDKSKKALDYEILLEKYREKYPDAGKSHMTKKINSLRTNFRRELKRLNNIRTSEADVKKFIEPNLWYFNQISFINFSESPGISRKNIKEDANRTHEKEETAPKKIQKSSDATDELIVLATQRLKQEPDNFKKMADIWASKLRLMNSTQQLYAEKFINDIIFEGVLGNLNKHSVQIIPCENMSTPSVIPCSSPISEDMLNGPKIES